MKLSYWHHPFWCWPFEEGCWSAVGLHVQHSSGGRTGSSLHSALRRTFWWRRTPVCFGGASQQKQAKYLVSRLKLNKFRITWISFDLQSCNFALRSCWFLIWRIFSGGAMFIPRFLPSLQMKWAKSCNRRSSILALLLRMTHFLMSFASLKAASRISHAPCLGTTPFTRP